VSSRFSPTNEPKDGQAFLAASLTCAFWAAWVGASPQLHTIEVVGPLFFWSFPVLIALLAWLFALFRARGDVSMERRIRGAATGIVAALLGFPLSVVSGVLLALGAFGPLIFFSVVLEAIVLAAGFAAMFGLYREAFRIMHGHPEPV
jgi:hypothetical protein